MRKTQAYLIIVCTAICSLALFGCNLPTGTPAPDLSGTIVASTLGALQTSVALTQTEPVAPTTPTLGLVGTPIPPGGATSSPTGSAGQNPLVKIDTLCWVGPGNQYEVVSAILAGNHIELIGRGTIPGWYIARNPIYHDPCWISANTVELPAGLDVSGLPYFSPPATPTPTPTKTPVNTATNTP